MDELVSAIASVGIPWARDAWPADMDQGPPYLCYDISDSDTLCADDRAVCQTGTVHVRLYTARKDPAMEARVEAALRALGTGWRRDEERLKTERVFGVIWQFDWITETYDE